MSLEDYTLTLTAEDIAQFQVPAKKLENFGNLTQQQINDILSDAYVPTNKDASITFSHLEYGDLIKIETDNVGYDIIAEKGNFPSWSELNTTYGINSAGEHFVHDDDYILMNESDFKKKLKKGIHMFTDLDQYNENSRKKILKMIINTKVLSENSSLIKFDVHYEQKKSTLQKLKDYLW